MDLQDSDDPTMEDNEEDHEAVFREYNEIVLRYYACMHMDKHSKLTSNIHQSFVILISITHCHRMSAQWKPEGWKIFSKMKLSNKCLEFVRWFNLFYCTSVNHPYAFV